MSDFVTESEKVKIRKPRPCTWCGEKIEKGEYAFVNSGVCQGNFFNSTFHEDCYAAYEKFVDDDDGFDHYSFARGCLCGSGRCECEHEVVDGS